MSENSVMISIQPKWVEKIANGQKTIEVRKTRPKIETPFKCYIYETKDKKYENMGVMGYRKDGTSYNFVNHIGKVIGEFTCDKTYEFHEWQLTPSKTFYEYDKNNLNSFLQESCLTYEEVCEYRKNLPYFKPLYGWHISDLKVYDKPRDLSEFKTICLGELHKCDNCPYYYYENIEDGAYEECCCNNLKPITRPPQSWQFITED